MGVRMRISKILCKVGIHRPLSVKDCAFIDRVSHKEVFNATCPCGKRWLSDSVFGWLGDKMEKPK